jgi:Flp pilus assembly protein TadD/uncharacterized coiled-coil DUF342 family protein
MVIGLTLPLGGAPDPADQYLQFYFQVQKAETAERGGNPAQALEQYEAAGRLLEALKKNSPDWRPELVTFRAKYCADKIADLRRSLGSQMSQRTPTTPPPPPPSTPTVPNTSTAQVPTPKAPTTTQRTTPTLPSVELPSGATNTADPSRELKQQLNALQQTLRETKEDLEQARKEAATAKSAQTLSTANATKFQAESEQRITSLTRERDQLQNQIKQMQETLGTASKGGDERMQQLMAQLDTTRKELEAAQQTSEATQQQLAKLQSERDELKAQFDTARKDLDLAKTELTPTKEQLTKLATERDQLRQKLDAIEKEIASRQKDAELARDEANSARENLKLAETSKSELAARIQTLEKDLEASRVAAVEKGRLNELTAEVERLREQLKTALSERDGLQSKLDTTQRELASLKSGVVDKRVAELLEKNAELTRRLDDAEKSLVAAKQGGSSEVEAIRDQLKSAQERLAAAEKQNAEYQKSTQDLTAKLAELQHKVATPDPVTVADPNLKKENELLRSILERQIKEQARRDAAKKLASEELQSLKVQSDVIAKQLDILGSPVVQLTEQERSLLKLPASVAASAAPSPDITAPLPENAEPSNRGGSVAVPPAMSAVAQAAGDAYKQRKFDEAADKYQDILKQYPDNVYALSNLGVVRYEQGRFREAEEALSRATKLEPGDAFSHSVLGIVYYMTQRYDEAISTLTRAATLDPNDARTRNYLGIACSQKGWLAVAEQELRKALDLDANYADAHFNLAVIYITQKPPAKEMARRHYDQARSLGMERDAELEKLLQ